MTEEGQPNQFVLPRSGKTTLRIWGHLLADVKEFTWRGFLYKRLFLTTSGKLVYQEQLSLTKSSKVWIREKSEARTMVNPGTIKVLTEAAKRDTDLESIIYEDLR